MSVLQGCRFSLVNDDAISGLRLLPDESIDCVVTSPPYFNMRDYKTAYWVGGDQNCDHVLADDDYSSSDRLYATNKPHRGNCKKCGATLFDKQIGLEKNVEDYVISVTEIFSEVNRVLKSDGTVFLNIGDTWSSANSSTNNVMGNPEFNKGRPSREMVSRPERNSVFGYKRKDLLMVPFRVALSLQQDGWYVRQAIIWHAPNKMPESVTDRCTNAHEYVFLLSKNPKYYFDYKAILEDASYDGRKDFFAKASSKYASGEYFLHSPQTLNTTKGSRWTFHNGVAKRRARSVWSIPTRGYKGEHYAPMPMALAEKCVIAGCRPGGIVLDPFCGSGTTIIAAMRNGRHGVGIDLSKKYCDIAKERIQKEMPYGEYVDLTVLVSGDKI